MSDSSIETRIPEDGLLEPVSRPSRRDENIKIIEKSGFNYIFVQNGDVFHRKTCKVCLNASRPILGAFCYSTAADGRRPCGICHPVPDTDPSVEIMQEAAEQPPSEPDPDRLINVKLITGKIVSINRSRIRGWCHVSLHPGALDKALMKEHDCLGKACSFLERNEQCSFWEQYDAQQRAKQQRKNRIREDRKQLREEESRLQALADFWQAMLHKMDSDMFIVRVEKLAPWNYKILYVSDNRYGDANKYVEFLKRLKIIYPRYRVQLCHIRDVDGHFVTTEEYLRRRNK